MEGPAAALTRVEILKSQLLNVLCNITVRLTFENVYYVEGAEVALARIKILKSQLAARFPV